MKRSVNSSSTDDIFRQAAADASRMQRARTYPVAEARTALQGLEDFMDEIEPRRNSHFTPDEWVALVKAEGILTEYLHDITH